MRRLISAKRNIWDIVIELIKRIFNRARSSQLARNTSWMFLGLGLKITIQAAYFILIARSLHLQGYGAFVGVCALVALLSPFASFGSGNLLIKNVARNADSFGTYWSNALLMILISGLVLLLTVLVVAQFFLPASIPLLLVFIVAVTDLFFARVLDISGQAFQALQRLHKTSLIQVLPNIFRLLAITGLFVYVKSPSPLQWSYLYLASTVISALIAVHLVHKELGPPIFMLGAMKALKAELREGFYFSVSLSARNVYNDIDKTMLARLSSLNAVGIYSAAYRIIDVSFTPIGSLLYASYARFFQHGSMGLRGSLAFAKKLVPVAGGYGIIGGIVIVIAAPLLPYILGTEYINAANALCWLSPLPFLKAVHYFAADTLTGSGFQGIVSGIQVVVAFFNIGINLWLIPAYSWQGAAWASIASDGLLAILLWTIIFYILKKT